MPVGQAQEPEGDRVVEGRVVSGTAGAGDVAGITVVWHEQSDVRHEHRQARTDSEGRFTFGGIEFDPEASYGFSVDYQGGLYGADLDLSGGSPPPVSVTVYEAMDADDLLTVTSASILLAGVDRAAQTVFALEVVRIDNPTDMTYVPGPEPMSLIRFGLPAGATNLRVDTALMRADFLQVDIGFALTASVPPGQHEVLYAYNFPYSGGHAVFTRSFPYGAGDVRVLAPYDVARLSSRELEGPEDVIIGDGAYQLLSGSEFARGSSISFDLLDLPEATVGERLGRRTEALRFEYAAPAGLGLMMAVLIVYALWRRRAARPARAAHGTEAPDEKQTRLVSEIAELEDSFEDGALSEAQYRRRRKALTARLAALAGSAPPPQG
jgi:hypothetical protein